MPRSVAHLKIIPKTTSTESASKQYKQSVGSVLLAKGWITQSDLLKAWSIQRFEQAYIGEILIGMGKITIDQLYWALSVQSNLDLIDLSKRPPSINWVDFSTPQISLKHGYIIWRNTRHSLTIALTSPQNIEMLQKTFQTTHKTIRFVLIKPKCLQDFIISDQSKPLQEAALTYCPETMSCRSWARPHIPYIWLATVVLLISASVFAPVKALSFVLTLVFFALIILMGLRIACLIALRKPAKQPVSIKQPQTFTKRPKVSILVPLFM